MPMKKAAQKKPVAKPAAKKAVTPAPVGMESSFETLDHIFQNEDLSKKGNPVQVQEWLATQAPKDHVIAFLKERGLTVRIKADPVQSATKESTTDECAQCISRYYFEAAGEKYCASGCGNAGRVPIAVAKPKAPAPVASAPVVASKSSSILDDLDAPIGDAIVSTGQDVTRKEEWEKIASLVDAGTGSSMEEIHDKNMKLLYVVDGSLSMADGMDPDEAMDEFLWTPELLQRFRAVLEAGGDLAHPDDAIEDFDEEFEDTPEMAASLTDDQLKQEIISNKLDQVHSIPLVRNPNYSPKSESKMRIVKAAAKDFVAQRFAKYPQALVALYEFSYQPSLRAPLGSSQSSVLEAIDGMYPSGGTCIFNAVNGVVGQCGKRKKEIGMHHIVLVSDGLDHSATQVLELISMMKDIGIVFDFIFVASKGATEYDKRTIADVSEALRRVCNETGGEFTEVNRPAEFRQKFLAASTRLCLPMKAGH